MTTSLIAEESFILIDGNTDVVIQEFGPYINERVTPACSFNIVLSLMGYDAKILKDTATPIWSFYEGYDDFLDSWKSSQTPQSWMDRSCVWFSKLISCEIGLEKFQYYLSIMDYGNQDLSAGLVKPGPLNPAWVSSSLTISPKEQVHFIQKLVLGELPVSQHASAMTKALLLKETLPTGWKLYGKTGLGTICYDNGESIQVRWFVGWIEKDAYFFPFAYQMRASEIDVTHTLPRVKLLLARYS